MFNCHITDPFDLNHNLGAGLSRKSMLLFLFLYFFLVKLYLFTKFIFLIWLFLILKKVTNFIMKAFINGRKVFGTPMKALPAVYTSEMVSTKNQGP